MASPVESTCSNLIQRPPRGQSQVTERQAVHMMKSCPEYPGSITAHRVVRDFTHEVFSVSKSPIRTVLQPCRGYREVGNSPRRCSDSSRMSRAARTSADPILDEQVRCYPHIATALLELCIRSNELSNARFKTDINVGGTESFIIDDDLSAGPAAACACDLEQGSRGRRRTAMRSAKATDGRSCASAENLCLRSACLQGSRKLSPLRNRPA